MATSVTPIPLDVLQHIKLLIDGGWTGQIAINFRDGAYMGHDLKAHFSAETQAVVLPTGENTCNSSRGRVTG
jgi:hypothetical protein